MSAGETEEAARESLAGHGWLVVHGLDFAPNTPGAESTDFDQVVVERRLRDAVTELSR